MYLNNYIILSAQKLNTLNKLNPSIHRFCPEFLNLTHLQKNMQKGYIVYTVITHDPVFMKNIVFFLCRVNYKLGISYLVVAYAKHCEQNLIYFCCLVYFNSDDFQTKFNSQDSPYNSSVSTARVTLKW